MTNNLNPVLHALRIAAAASALLAATAIHAQTITGVDGSGAPGGIATVGFDFDFGSGVSIAAFDSMLSWSPAQLTLVGSSVSYHGSVVDVATVLSASGQFSPFDDSANGMITATWFALDGSFNPLPPLALDGQGHVSLTFALAAALPAGTQSDVVLDFTPSYDLTGAGPDPIQATAVVTAVPEPQTWALLLAGGAGLGALMRRRERKHA